MVENRTRPGLEPTTTRPELSLSSARSKPRTQKDLNSSRVPPKQTCSPRTTVWEPLLYQNVIVYLQFVVSEHDKRIYKKKKPVCNKTFFFPRKKNTLRFFYIFKNFYSRDFTSPLLRSIMQWQYVCKYEISVSVSTTCSHQPAVPRSWWLLILLLLLLLSALCHSP